MDRIAVIAVLAAGLCATVASGVRADPATPQQAPPPPIASQTTMLYYDDLQAAEEFYGVKLGLSKTRDFGWAKLFRTSASAEIGLVQSGKGYFRAQPHNAVMLSIVTTEIDDWYQRLKADSSIVFLIEIKTSESVPIRNFMIRDPGGYAVEFFQWL
jgi:hypothetical protein